MTDHIEVMAKALHPWLYSEYVDDQAARAAPLPAGDDGELVGWLRKFGPTAKTTTEQNLMDQAASRIAALNAEVARKDEALVAAQREITALNDALAQAGGSFDA